MMTVMTDYGSDEDDHEDDHNDYRDDDDEGDDDDVAWAFIRDFEWQGLWETFCLSHSTLGGILCFLYRLMPTLLYMLPTANDTWFIVNFLVFVS